MKFTTGEDSSITIEMTAIGLKEQFSIDDLCRIIGGIASGKLPATEDELQAVLTAIYILYEENNRKNESEV